MDNLENRVKNSYSLIEAVAGFSLASAVLLSVLPQYRPYGLVAGGASIGVYACSVATKRRAIEASESFLEAFQKDSLQHSQNLSQALQDCEKERQQLKRQLEQASKALESLQSENSSVALVKERLLRKLEELQEKNAELQVEVGAKVELLKDWGKQAIECWTDRLNGLFNHYSKYPECKKRLGQFSEEVSLQSCNYLNQLTETYDLGELLATFQALTESFQSLSTRLRKSCEVSRYQAKFLEAKGLEDEIIELQEQQKAQIAKLHADYKSVIKEFQIDYQQFQQNAVDALEEARDTSTYDEFFVKVQDTIAGLTAQLEQAKKPHEFPTGLEAHRLGNLLIAYYYKQGITLDACDFDTTDTGFKLYFYFDRNRRHLTLEALNSESALAQIKQLFSALNQPKFAFTERSIRLVLEVQTTHPKRKEVDLARLTTPVEAVVEKILKEMTRKSTVRVMGATGDGKGIFSRYLVSEIVKRNPWYLRLHDPQHGSAEDYWGIPKVSKSGEEMKAALAAIADQMLARESSKIHSPVTLDVLDEVDTQLEKSDKQQFVDLISRIRHLGMKLVLIGQNPKVGRVGLQWSDMAQMTCIYMMGSALDAINNYPALENDKEKLSKQYHELNREIQERNETLDDAKKYYFGLCVIPGKSPMWFVLPPADTVRIACDSKLLAEKFAIPNSFKEFINCQNPAQNSCLAALTNSNVVSLGQGLGKPEIQINQGFQPLEEFERLDSPMQGDTAQTAQAAQTALNSCKIHPDAKLRLCKDGRFYCPSCRKKLGKSELV